MAEPFLVCGVDGSAQSRLAARLACALAARLGHRPLIVHVVPEGRTPMLPPGRAPSMTTLEAALTGSMAHRLSRCGETPVLVCPRA